MEIETHCATRGIPSVNGAKTQQTQVLVDALHGILERTAQGEVVRGELLRNVQDTARKQVPCTKLRRTSVRHSEVAEKGWLDDHRWATGTFIAKLGTASDIIWHQAPTAGVSGIGMGQGDDRFIVVTQSKAQGKRFFQLQSGGRLHGGDCTFSLDVDYKFVRGYMTCHLTGYDSSISEVISFGESWAYPGTIVQYHCSRPSSSHQWYAGTMQQSMCNLNFHHT
jgi:hypothetical protein